MWLAHPRDVIWSAAHLSNSSGQSILASMLRIGPGLIVVFAVGVPLGLILGYMTSVYRVLEGPLDFWRSIPPLAVLPICFFLFADTGDPWLLGLLKTGDQARIASVVFGCLPILVFQVADAVRSIPVERRDFATQMEASLWFRTRWLLAYELMPIMFLSMRTVVSFSVVIIVAGEMTWGAGSGLGDRINETRYAENGLPASYVFAIAAGLIGYSVNLLIRWLESQAIRWK
jgi:ABC-type nitrate/sulfonate/bicarbonate transport system permease component